MHRSRVWLWTERVALWATVPSMLLALSAHGSLINLLITLASSAAAAATATGLANFTSLSRLLLEIRKDSLELGPVERGLTTERLDAAAATRTFMVVVGLAASALVAFVGVATRGLVFTPYLEAILRAVGGSATMLSVAAAIGLARQYLLGEHFAGELKARIRSNAARAELLARVAASKNAVEALKQNEALRRYTETVPAR